MARFLTVSTRLAYQVAIVCRRGPVGVLDERPQFWRNRRSYAPIEGVIRPGKRDGWKTFRNRLPDFHAGMAERETLDFVVPVAGCVSVFPTRGVWGPLLYGWLSRCWS